MIYTKLCSITNTAVSSNELHFGAEDTSNDIISKVTWDGKSAGPWEEKALGKNGIAAAIQVETLAKAAMHIWKDSVSDWKENAKKSKAQRKPTLSIVASNHISSLAKKTGWKRVSGGWGKPVVLVNTGYDGTAESLKNCGQTEEAKELRNKSQKKQYKKKKAVSRITTNIHACFISTRRSHLAAFCRRTRRRRRPSGSCSGRRRRALVLGARKKH